ncbi:MAG: ABC transporter ATP-binding protein [Micromonosporaceae bacterium]
MSNFGGPVLGGPMRMRPEIETLGEQKISAGTVRRILPYAAKHRWSLVALLLTTATGAAIAATIPAILKLIIDDGIQHGRMSVVVWLALLIAGLSLVDAAASWLQAWLSARVGQGLVYDLRTRIFDHVQRQPIAFFARTQTGALVSRLNTDIVGAQQAITILLSQSASTILTIILVVSMMFYLSWQISAVALLMIPIFLLPAKLIGRAMQRLTRQRMQLDGELGSLMSERFNVSGAMLTKLYGEPERESAGFADRAAQVRDVATRAIAVGSMLAVVVTVLTSMTTAVVYGFGGSLVIAGTLQLGTLVAMVTLLMRLYGPVNQLSSIHVNFMTALVSFDRVFEVMDLEPLITERESARPLAVTATGNGSGTTAPDIEFDQVSFRYPSAREVSLASLESIGRPVREQQEQNWILRDLSFRAPGGKLTALVGPSGAGKTTITHLVPRLFDAVSGTVRIGGEDVRDLTLRSLSAAVGVVPQEAHMFHDTIRANLQYAKPDATDEELVEACRAAQIWDTVGSLPDGLDTMVGDRGYRLSGGEKQRVALARLLLKSPPIVVLDEATAHLDSESEAAVQRALVTALAGRTSVVIAHRLSTIREADQILVVEQGQIRQSGTHQELLAAGGLYADLYRTQFALQEDHQVIA